MQAVLGREGGMGWGQVLGGEMGTDWPGVSIREGESLICHFYLTVEARKPV